jgi:hypothetical protein
MDRGEIPRTVDAHQLLLTATGPVYHQLVLLRQPMSRAQADRHARIAAKAFATAPSADLP